jgi:hypothetical protein
LLVCCDNWGLFSLRNFLKNGIVALSLLFNNQCLIMV